MTPTPLVAIVATSVALICAACDGNGRADATSTSGPTPTLSAALPTSSAPVPAYLQDLAPHERMAFTKAVRAYRAFLAEQAEIAATGHATSAARQYYQRSTADWQTYWATLKQRDADGISIRGSGRVIRIRPGSIRLHGDGTGTIRLRVCGSSKGVRVFDGDKEIPQTQSGPRTVDVAMVRLERDSAWRVLNERVGPRC